MVNFRIIYNELSTLYWFFDKIFASFCFFIYVKRAQNLVQSTDRNGDPMNYWSYLLPLIFTDQLFNLLL